MEKVLLLTLMLIVTPAATAAGGSVKPRSVMHTTVTGEIRRLDPHSIVVGHVVCTIPQSLSVSTGRFVIGDPVRISCLGGNLKGVKYSPPIDNQTDARGTGNSQASLPSLPAPSCGLSCAHSVSYSIGMIFFGGGPTGETSSATGQITDVSDGSVTAGGLSCSFRSFVDNLINQAARIGDNVTLTCTGGVFVGMKSVGTVTR